MGPDYVEMAGAALVILLMIGGLAVSAFKTFRRWLDSPSPLLPPVEKHDLKNPDTCPLCHPPGYQKAVKLTVASMKANAEARIAAQAVSTGNTLFHQQLAAQQADIQRQQSMQHLNQYECMLRQLSGVYPVELGSPRVKG